MSRRRREYHNQQHCMYISRWCLYGSRLAIGLRARRVGLKDTLALAVNLEERQGQGGKEGVEQAEAVGHRLKKLLAPFFYKYDVDGDGSISQARDVCICMHVRGGGKSGTAVFFH